MLTNYRGFAARRAVQGFTLVETLLAASLFLLFSAAAILSLDPASRGSGLDQGAVRLESLLRFARAEAANTGRRVRDLFVHDARSCTNQPNQIRLLWEPEPLDEPEVFQDLSRAHWEADDFSEGANVAQIRMIDSSDVPAAGESSNPGSPDEEVNAAPSPEPRPITFNPDGSGDSAEIILVARNPDDSRRITVRVIGLTGMISREVTPDRKGDAGTDGHERTPEAGPSVVE